MIKLITPKSIKRQLIFYSLILTCFFVVIITCDFANPYQTGNASSPNIVFIILDAARADHFSCYGYQKNTTPCIDAISRGGVLFLNNFSQATYTSESVSRFMSSRYFSLPICDDYGLIWASIKKASPTDVFLKFDDQQIFLPEVLSMHGYRTALFSNHTWFTKDTYFVQQFDEFFSFDVSRDYPADKEIFTSVAQWIKKNRKKRFFIYCHLMSPHKPYLPKEEESEFLPNADFQSLNTVRNKLNYAVDTREEIKEGDLPYVNGLYDGKLKHTDKWIGALYNELGKIGLANNTFFIISSDHGENLDEHGSGPATHGGPPWDSVIHVPLIMVYPPLIAGGIRVESLTEAIDIMPTILDICGIELPQDKSMDGASLLMTINNPSVSRKAVFTSDSIRTANYKYIYSEDFLYDLRKDPQEKCNIAKERPLIKAWLRTKFKRALSPYKKRYLASKKESPPDFTFYYDMNSFEIEPRKIVKICRYKIPEFIKKNATDALNKTWQHESWLRDTIPYLPGIMPISTKVLVPPLTLSSKIPNSTYQVYLLLESTAKFPSSADKIGFKFRFSPYKSFSVAKGIEPTEGIVETNFYAYLDLGKIVVRQYDFWLEFNVDHPDKTHYVIRHIKFMPIKYQKKESIGVPDKDKRRRKLEELKSLGYL